MPQFRGVGQTTLFLKKKFNKKFGVGVSEMSNKSHLSGPSIDFQCVRMYEQIRQFRRNSFPLASGGPICFDSGDTKND